MKPYGQNKIRMANTIDNHINPKRIFKNWWEGENKILGNREKQRAKKEIKSQLTDVENKH